MAWCVADGFDLYLRTEPSTFVLRTVALLGAAAVLAGGCALWRQFFRSAAQPPATPMRRKSWRRLLLLLPLAAYAGVSLFAVLERDNVRMSCRMQNELDNEDWDAMIETAQATRRPSRSVAAFNAVALEHTDRLLDGLFAIPYDYPDLHPA